MTNEETCLILKTIYAEATIAANAISKNHSCVGVEYVIDVDGCVGFFRVLVTEKYAYDGLDEKTYIGMRNGLRGKNLGTPFDDLQIMCGRDF